MLVTIKIKFIYDLLFLVFSKRIITACHLRDVVIEEFDTKFQNRIISAKTNHTHAWIVVMTSKLVKHNWCTFSLLESPFYNAESI